MAKHRGDSGLLARVREERRHCGGRRSSSVGQKREDCVPHLEDPGSGTDLLGDVFKLHETHPDNHGVAPGI